MRILYPVSMIYIALILSSCATTPTPPPVETTTVISSINPTCCTHKDPLSISLLNTPNPGRPYHVLAKAMISEYNNVGVKRQQATINDIMRELAASVNGDAVIDITRDDKKVTATVIAYKPVMV